MTNRKWLFFKIFANCTFSFKKYTTEAPRINHIGLGQQNASSMIGDGRVRRGVEMNLVLLLLLSHRKRLRMIQRGACARDGERISSSTSFPRTTRRLLIWILGTAFT